MKLVIVILMMSSGGGGGGGGSFVVGLRFRASGYYLIRL